MFLLLVTTASPKSLSSLQSTVLPALSTVDDNPITSTNGESSRSDVSISYETDITSTSQNPTIADHETTHTTDFTTDNHGGIGSYADDTTTSPSTSDVVPNRDETANGEPHLPITSVNPNSTPDSEIHSTPPAPIVVTGSRRVVQPVINSIAKRILQMSLTHARIQASDALENYVSTDSIYKKNDNKQITID